MNDFVTIATFDDYITANFGKQKLEEAGIVCYLADENTVTMQWTLMNAVGGIKLRVQALDADKANGILREEREQLPVDFEVEGGNVACPSCGSNNTVKEKYSKSLLGLSWLILGFPIAANVNKTSRCFYCGHTWNS